jgi:hypothetical protein
MASWCAPRARPVDEMTAVNWLVSQPWPVFLPLWLGPLALLTGLLLAFAHHRRPPERTVTRRKVSDWDMHPCGCFCEGRTIYPCAGHKGQAAAALHQEAP